MHIESLKIFCDLVDLQSFSLAAERNFVTQSAVSQQIKALEDRFNRQLLERVRGRREVRLTGAGEVFYREADSSRCLRPTPGEPSRRCRQDRRNGQGLVCLQRRAPRNALKVGEYMSKFPAARIDMNIPGPQRSSAMS